MKMRYVSNAGIVFETEQMSMAIDCFCKDENGIYRDLEQNVKEELFADIENGTIRILVFTHEHGDHFFAPDVKTACEKNKGLQVWAGKRVIQRLEKEGVSPAQLVEVYPGEIYTLGSGKEEAKLRFLKTLHDGEQYAEIENFSLFINIGRKSYVVTGDAMPRAELFEEIAGWETVIDWLIAPFPYVGLRTARRAICSHLNIRNIFVLHQPKVDAQKWVENTKNVCKQAKDELPYPVFADSPNKWYEI